MQSEAQIRKQVELMEESMKNIIEELDKINDKLQKICQI